MKIYSLSVSSLFLVLGVSSLVQQGETQGLQATATFVGKDSSSSSSSRAARHLFLSRLIDEVKSLVPTPQTPEEERDSSNKWVDLLSTSLAGLPEALSFNETEFFEQVEEDRRKRENEDIQSLISEQHVLSLSPGQAALVRSSLSNNNKIRGEEGEISKKSLRGEEDTASLSSSSSSFPEDGASSSLSRLTWVAEAWMTRLFPLIAEKKITEITIPGTHDSGAYQLTEELVPGDLSDTVRNLIKVANALGIRQINRFILRLSEAQDKSLYDQLRLGVRYFDLRAAWDSKTQQWRSFHAVFGLPIEGLLREIRQFLTEQPGEIVMVEISHFRGDPTVEQKRQLREMVLSTLQGYLAPRPESGDIRDTPKIAELVSKNYRAFVAFEDDQLVAELPGRELWPFSSFIFNSYADSCDLEQMYQYNLQQSKAARERKGNPPFLYKLSWTLTLQAGCIIKEVLNPFGKRSLVQFGEMANKDERWVKFADQARAGDRGSMPATRGFGNIVIVDHIQSSLVVNQLVGLNSRIGEESEGTPMA